MATHGTLHPPTPTVADPLQTMPPSTASWVVTDAALLTGNFQSELVGTGAHTHLQDNSTLTELRTGNTATGYAARRLPDSTITFSATSGTYYYQLRNFTIPVFATTPQGFLTRAGFLDVFNSAGTVVDGVYFQCNRPTTAAAVFIARANSVATVVTTTFTPAVGVAYDYLISVDRDVTAKLYYRLSAKQAWPNPWGWTLIGTIASGIPTGTARNTSAGVVIAKATGTETRSVTFASQVACQVSE